MSIILKGIDLPDEKLMEMFESDDHICIGGNCYPLMIKDVIQIPKNHGRLIDADLFKELIKDSVPAWTIGVKIPTYGDMDIMDKIYFIPTILEAEP